MAAAEILRLSEHSLGNTVAKLRRIYKDVLLDCTSSGKISFELYDLLLGIGVSIRFDTQNVEGCNNHLKMICVKQCPWISLPALTNRVMLRRALFQVCWKWSQIKDMLDYFRGLIIDHLPDGESILADKSRFTTPEPFVCCTQFFVQACFTTSDPNLMISLSQKTNRMP